MNVEQIRHSPKRAALQARCAAFLSQAPLLRGVRSHLGFSAGSVKGPVRKENQDRAIVARLVARYPHDEDLFVAVVCDGMGGLQRGGDAATIAASVFISELATAEIIELEAKIKNAVVEANRAVFKDWRLFLRL